MDKAMAPLLPPVSASLVDVAQEFGVSIQTLEKWRVAALSQPAGTKACTPTARFTGITVRTLQRWQTQDGFIKADARHDVVRATPSHALSEAEPAEVLRVVNEPRFADQPPARIVPARRHVHGGWKHQIFTDSNSWVIIFRLTSLANF